MTPAKSSSRYTRLAKVTAHAAGQPLTFTLALVVIMGWAVSGPLFHWSDTWQLVVNTGTTIITFLMVFLIQSTQNRDNAAIQAKLDEIIHTGDSDDKFIGIEHLSDEELEKILADVEQSAGRLHAERRKRGARRKRG